MNYNKMTTLIHCNTNLSISKNTVLAMKLSLQSSDSSMNTTDRFDPSPSLSKSFSNALYKSSATTSDSIQKLRGTESPLDPLGLSLSSSLSSSHRSVSRRVTNDNSNDNAPSLSLLSTSQSLQHKEQQNKCSSVSASRDHTATRQKCRMMEDSYLPTTKDVILNDHKDHQAASSTNEHFDTYIRSILPLYQQMIRQERYNLQYSLLQNIVESIEREGGHFLREQQQPRTDHDSGITTTTTTASSKQWIQVSPMLAQMYVFYRLKQEYWSILVTSDPMESDVEEEIVVDDATTEEIGQYDDTFDDEQLVLEKIPRKDEDDSNMVQEILQLTSKDDEGSVQESSSVASVVESDEIV
jgi:hypothetical protein